MSATHTSSRPVTPISEWQDEVKARGGLDCGFVCPMCGHVATPRDFKALNPDLTDPGVAARECIGREMPRDQARSAMNDSGDGPCDYAAWGLFDLCKVAIEREGKQLGVFEFAPDEPTRREEHRA